MSRQTVSKAIREVLPNVCCNCGSTENLVYHHIVPVVRGGKDVPSNIAVVCCDCHSIIHHGTTGKVPHSGLVKDGIARAKAEGRNVGRKPADYEKVMRLIAEHSTQFNDVYDPNYELYTEHEIMEMGNVKEVTYSKCKRMLIADMSADKWEHEWSKPKRIYRNMPLYDRFVRRIRDEGRKLKPNLSNADRTRINEESELLIDKYKHSESGVL